MTTESCLCMHMILYIEGKNNHVMCTQLTKFICLHSTYYLSTYLYDPNQIMTWKWQHAQSARIFRARKEPKGRTGTNIFKVI